MSEPTSHELLTDFQAGQSEAATIIFNRYVERLLALARNRIAPKLRRRLDPEDIVQSAYRSFFVHARNEEYQLSRAGDLWRLLASITLNKLHGQIEKQTAAKRTIERETPDEFAIANLNCHEPTVIEVIAVGEQLNLILNGLSPDERLVLASTLQGQSIEEIGRLIGKSERSVRRLLERAKRQFERRLLKTDVSAKNNRANRAQIIEPQAPLKFTDYKLEQLLGSGGMGKVYRATDKRSGKTVAVKALHKARLYDSRAVANFVQEAQILAQLRHKNIVGLQGLGCFPAGGYFIVMDYVAGADLQSRLEEGPLPLDAVLPIVSQIASAVQHAHDHGIVHCDLKPANVLIDNYNQVFVTDFGFAFIVAGASQATEVSIGGTAGYMAPEVLQFQSQPTRAADIYALGVLLWKLATGKLPKDRDCVQTQDKALGPLVSICRKCLAENPGERYRNVTSLIRDIGKLQ